MDKKEKFIIQGLAGQKSLSGVVHINGAKNSALKAIASSILFSEIVTLKNVPDTSDIHTLIQIIKRLGAKVEIVRGENNSSALTLKVDPSNISSTDIDPELAKTMRASVVLTGPLLARFGKVSFPAPGGCVIGARPIDLFIQGYKKLGATVNDSKDSSSIISKGLVGTEIFFNKQTVGGTETLMMAGVLAEGKTVLKNCAMEPEIVNVAEWLNSCGANIKGAGTTTIEIVGTSGKLLTAKEPFVTIPDRITAGSFLLLGALCAKDLRVANCEPKHLESVTSMLMDSGVPIQVGSDFIEIKNNTQPNSSFKALNDIRTHEYPGFPTDLQAPLVVFLTQISGQSKVLETIYEGRFKYVEDLVKLGANITILNPREISIKGPTKLEQTKSAPELPAHDIRAGFAIVMASLCASGGFTVNNVHLIDRGYEHLEKKLQNLGAQVERVSND